MTEAEYFIAVNARLDALEAAREETPKPEKPMDFEEMARVPNGVDVSKLARRLATRSRSCRWSPRPWTLPKITFSLWWMHPPRF